MAAWKTLFSTIWTRFDQSFKTIRESLAKNSDLAERSAIAIDINEAKAWRAKSMEESARRERENAILQRQAVLSWLKNGDSVQEDELDVQLSRGHPKTCDWFTENAKISTWRRSNQDHKVLWLKGKPGSGRSNGGVHIAT